MKLLSFLEEDGSFISYSSHISNLLEKSIFASYGLYQIASVPSSVFVSPKDYECLKNSLMTDRSK